MSPDPTREMIVLADDFGLDPRVNEGVVQSCTEGIVSGASLLVTADHADEAVTVARREGVPVGLHLSIVQETPISPAEDISTLVDANGQFYPHYAQFLRAFITGRIDLEEVEREWRRQFQAFVKTDLELYFVNSHEHLHLVPGLFGIVRELCEEFEVPHLRTADELSFPGRSSVFNLPVHGLKILSKWSKRSLAQGSTKTNDWFSGVHLVDAPGQNEWREFLMNLPGGLTEIGVHVATEEIIGEYGVDKPREHEAMLEVLCADWWNDLASETEVRIGSLKGVIRQSSSLRGTSGVQSNQ